MSQCKYGILSPFRHRCTLGKFHRTPNLRDASPLCTSRNQRRSFWKESEKSKPSSPKAPVKTSENPLQYCMKLVRERDYEGYMQCLNFPTGGPQEAAIAIRAFNVEVAQTRGQIARNYSDVAGKFRLQFWKDTLRTIYGEEGAPAAVPRQPVAAMLQRFVGPERGKVSKQYLHNLVEARQKTLQDRQFLSISDLNSFSFHTQGGMLFAFLQILDVSPEDPHVAEVVQRLSHCLGILTQLRAVVPLAQSGVVLLPNNILVKHGVKAVDIARGSRDQKIKDMALDFGRIASEDLKKARELRGKLPGKSWMALQSTVTADYLLRVLKISNGDLFSGRFQQRNPWLGVQLLKMRMMRRY